MKAYGMKIALCGLLALASTSVFATGESGINLSSGFFQSFSFSSVSDFLPSVKGRTGSRRVGGSGSSGKGGHYVGGRR